MKKLFLTLALLPLLFSCETIPEDNPDYPDPAYLQYAGRLTLNGVTTKAVYTPGRLVSIELTESGIYAIGRYADELGTIAYTAGAYTVSGHDYRLSGFGTISFNNSQEGFVELTIKPDEGYQQLVWATLKKADSSNKAYRAWNVEKTRVTVKGWRTISADFIGCDFKEIADFLRANGHKAPVDVPDHGIRSISLTGTETMIIAYDDGSADLNEFSLNGNVIKYTWSDNMKGFTFETEKAVISYMDGKCILTINGKIRDSSTSGSVTFMMSPYNP
jgi:hypothetical protein